MRTPMQVTAQPWGRRASQSQLSCDLRVAVTRVSLKTLVSCLVRICALCLLDWVLLRAGLTETCLAF